MIRVLHVVSIMNSGGMENYIMNIYRLVDRKKIQFDFLVHHKKKGFFEDEINELGGKVYHFSVLDDKNLFKYKKEINNFFAEHSEYNIVHGHLSSLAYWYLGVAKKHGVTHRIAHSHGAGFLHTPKGVAKFILFKGAKINANRYFACSAVAGEYLFGKRDFEFVPNGIDSKRFQYNEYERNTIRKELGVEDAFLIGHVGRFNLQKNHEFLLKVFKRFYEQNKNSKLLLLGDGELEEKTLDKVEQLGLTDCVIFAGVKKDCERYYQAMDVFVLPSLFEGLPVTGIEAQYAGLPCLLSEKITREVKISQNTKFIGINDSDIEEWNNQLNFINKNTINRYGCVYNNMFDVEFSARKMIEYYEKMEEECKC